MFNQFRLIALLSLVGAATFLTSCQGQALQDKGPAFYYWQTTLNFDTTAVNLSTQLQNQHFYLRYMDIDWSAGYGMAIPLGVLDPGYSVQGWDKKTITPTIYITNRTFQNIKESDIPGLVSRLTRKVEQITKDLLKHSIFGYNYISSMPENLPWEERHDIADSLMVQWQKNVKEIQIDCDWTESTRDKYFQFLKILQANVSDYQITCTLRLHQYRDRKLMGIPPVEKVMLMCYNTGNPQMYQESNAILNAEVVKQYLKGKKYPRQMELALPAFNWGAWYRAGQFQGLLRNLSADDSGIRSFLQHEQNNRYRVTQDTLMGRDYLREGDLIRMDGPTPEQMQTSIAIIKKQLGHRFSRLAFFDWEPQKIKANQATLLEYFKALKN